MNKMVKIIIGIAIAIIILIIIILGLLKNADSSQIPSPPVYVEEDFKVNYSVRQINSVNEYYILKNIVDSYYSYCKKLNTTSTDIETYKLPLTGKELEDYVTDVVNKEKQKAKDYLFSVLDNKYKQEYSITQDNLSTKFGLQIKPQILINQIYMVDNSINVFTYYISGTSIDEKTSQISNFNIAITLDMLNHTFAIDPQEHIQKQGYDKIKVGDTIENTIDSIQKGEYNSFEYTNIEQETIATDYFNDYKTSLTYDRNRAYELLDKEYKEKRFGNIEEYKNYIQENNYLLSATIEKYQVVEENNTKQYIVVDNYNNYYIFNITNPVQYSLSLDTYTIDSEKFINTYHGSNASKKVQLNIDKFIQMINAKDYRSSYQVLDDGFKNNYFNTLDSYRTYIKNYFFESNQVVYNNITTQGDIYIYNITLLDKTQKSVVEKNLNIIMKLEEGTNFVMSFSINQ